MTSNFEISERLADQRAVADVRYEAAQKSHDLEVRLRGLERLVGWLTETVIGLISAGAGIAAVAYWYDLQWQNGSALLVFLGVMLGTNFIFRKVAGWCLET